MWANRWDFMKRPSVCILVWGVMIPDAGAQTTQRGTSAPAASSVSDPVVLMVSIDGMRSII